MNSKKALIITNRVRKIPGGLTECIITPLKNLGYDVTWAADFSVAKFDLNQAPCNLLKTNSRSNPLNIKNISTYKTILQFVKSNDVDLIHCNTPIGGLIGRMVGKKHKSTVIIYQAHGFLFFKHGPKLGFLYKCLEKRLARYTDYLITINQEDFSASKTFKLRNGSKHCYLVHGSGMNLTFSNHNEDLKKDFLKAIGISDDKKIIISIGELNKNKNVATLVKAIPYIDNSYICLICGEGKQLTKLTKLSQKLKIDERVFFLGYRTDIPDLLSISSLYVSTSKREGLSRTISESMAAGLPCIVSNRRGLKDLIIDNEGGFLIEPNDYLDLAKKINYLNTHIDVYEKMSSYNIDRIQMYSSSVVQKEMVDIYRSADNLVNEKNGK